MSTFDDSALPVCQPGKTLYLLRLASRLTLSFAKRLRPNQSFAEWCDPGVSLRVTSCKFGSMYLRIPRAGKNKPT
jgi:hypothetical protein